MVGLGRPVSRVEMNAKYAPLTPPFPNRRYPMLFLRPKTSKKHLTGTDTVIHGAQLLNVMMIFEN